MIIELIAIGASIAFLSQLRKKRTSPVQWSTTLIPKLLKQLPIRDSKKLSPQENKIYKNMMILPVSLGLVTIGTWSFSLLGVIIYLYATAPIIISDLYKSLIKEKRVSMALLEFTLISLMLVTDNFFAAILGGFLYLLSKTLVLKTEDNSRKNLVNIFGQQQTFAWLKIDGGEIKTPIEKLRTGDVIIVYAGESIPIDGVVTAGIAEVDQRILTGESHPVDKEKDDCVFASTVVLTGQVEIKVEKAGQETVSAQIGKILMNTSDFKMTMQSRGEQIADQTALPTLIIGGIAFLAGFSGIKVAALMNANFGYNMRVVAPISMLNYLSLTSHHGILVKDGRALELLEKVDTVIFDKTGTLTDEQPTIGDIHLCGQYTANELLRYAATAEQKQKHPVALAIIQEAKARKLDLLAVNEASYSIGYGLTVQIENKWIQIGSLRFAELQKIAIPETIQSIQSSCEQKGISLVAMAIDEQLVGVFEIHATIRSEAQQVIDQLKQKNQIKSIYIISGDNEAPTKKLAQQLGINKYFANVLPDDKAKIIKKLQDNGKYICYVGDGINDSIALKQAHVSISMSGASTAAIDTASIVLMDGNLSKFYIVFDIAGQFSRNLKRNLYITILPGVISMGGVLFFHFGIISTILLNQVGLAVGMANTLLPLHKMKR